MISIRGGGRSKGVAVRHAILVGGFGTRLRPVTNGLPKALAPVQGRPFLEWLLRALHRRGVRRAVLCAGFGHDLIEGALGDGHRIGVRLTYSVEKSPLGTAGAVALALPLLDDPFVLWNGDTFSTVNWRRLLARHAAQRALATIAVVRVADARDFGCVALGRDHRIVAFEEKCASGARLINSGVYAMSHAAFRSVTVGKARSLERDLLPHLIARTRRVSAYLLRRPVFDIGTPDRLIRFSKELSRGELVRP